MRFPGKIFRSGVRQGFTLVEILIAMAILAITFAATISLVGFHRIQVRKAIDEALMLDFSQHYLEQLRSLDYDKIAVGNAIGALYDGSGSLPDIPIPSQGSWIDLNTDDFETFHPDLIQMENRSPQYRLTITEEATSRSKHIDYETRWKPPLNRGADWVTIRLTLVVYQDFS